MEFIDYSLMIVVIMICYYIFRFFTLGRAARDGNTVSPFETPRPGAVEAANRRRESNQQQAEQRNARQGVQQRTRWLGSARDLLRRRVIPACNRARRSLRTRSASNLNAGNARIREIQTNLERVRDLIASSQNNLEPPRAAQLGRWYDYAELMLEYLEDNVINHMPSDANDQTVWDANTPAIRDNLREMNTMAGVLWTALNDFIENDNIEAPPNVLGSRSPGGGPTPTPTPGGPRRPVPPRPSS